MCIADWDWVASKQIGVELLVGNNSIKVVFLFVVVVVIIYSSQHRIIINSI